ncbi:hypothetical protein L3X38_033774 [Prunus dulcis]|uniref:Uncharacterized protein n=1 Tax=Prunus dulcis TaxID=3755 RepID=A0AAD4VHM5_PRUDU|nr:hypothetical protein L3X38_033774 [Prunus dulcis]
MFIAGREKIRYLTRTIPEHAPDAVTYDNCQETWELVVDSILISWFYYWEVYSLLQYLPLCKAVFQKNGYPKWWDSYKERRACEGHDTPRSRKEGKTTVCTTELTPLIVAVSHVLSITSTLSGVDTAHLQQSSNIGLALLAIDSQKDYGWILDYGAIDHMMFDASLIHNHRSLASSTVANTNGVPSPITGSVDLTHSLTLEHTLLVPTPSKKFVNYSANNKTIKLFSINLSHFLSSSVSQQR